MAWTDLSFPAGSLLTSTKMTQVFSNFGAMGAQAAGAPLISFPNSPTTALQATGVASLQTVDVASKANIGGLAPAAPALGDIYRDSVPGAWVTFNGSAIEDDYNVNNVTAAPSSTGLYQVTFATSFETATYLVWGTAKTTGGIFVTERGDIQKIGKACYVGLRTDAGGFSTGAFRAGFMGQ